MNQASLLCDLDVARAKSQGESDDVLLRRLIDDVMQDLALEPPISPEIVASFRGISRIDELSLPYAGMLVHEGDQVVIRVRETDGRGRRRFSTFHEIAHTFLPGFMTTQYRCDPLPGKPTQRTRQGDVEGLADLGASEMLMPRAMFTADLAGNVVTMELVEELAGRYDASLVATAVRAVILAPTDAALVVLEPAAKPSDPDGEPVLRVQWATNKGNWPHIPKHKSVEIGSVFDRALNGEVVNETSRVTGLVREPLPEAHVSARLYPHARHGETVNRVLALLTKPELPRVS